jgi:hypothetical protein
MTDRTDARPAGASPEVPPVPQQPAVCHCGATEGVRAVGWVPRATIDLTIYACPEHADELATAAAGAVAAAEWLIRHRTIPAPIPLRRPAADG